MPSLPGRTDVAVLGAGSAGAAVAALCAERGLSVVCLDRRPLDDAGARWVNGVPRWTFERAGLPVPSGETLRGADVPFHLVAGWGPHRVVITDHGVLEVDMRGLVSDLQALARARGAVLSGEVQVESVEDGRVRTDRGVVSAGTIVDASGLSGMRLLGTPPPPPADLCTAAQAVHALADPAGARAFFDRHRVPLGETLCFTGIEGGYSILNLRVEGDEVSLLTGSLAARGYPSGQAILDRFLERAPWIGERRFGGARAVPLSLPASPIARGRIALVGDAAHQVLTAHGSGVGIGLVAAAELAGALARGEGPAGYAVRFQRRYGGLLAGYEAFRRLSESLSPSALEALFASGLMDPELARDGLAQRLPRPSPAALRGKARALAAAPGLAARVAGAAARMAIARSVYAGYPAHPAAQRAVDQLAARLLARTPLSPSGRDRPR